MGKLRAQKRKRSHVMIISFMFYVLVVDNEALVNKIDVLVNDLVTMHCDTKVSIDIQWHHNSLSNYVYAGRRLRGSYLERFRSEYDNGTYTLIIPKVRSEDAGWYYCSEELSGRRISSTHLTVLYSDPVCYSNMHPDGFVGPNTCNLEQENMVFSCVVSFNGISPPHLMWKLLNDNRTINSSICEDKPNRRNCSLILKSDPIYDGSIFICQTTSAIDSRFNCSTEDIKISYLHASRSITQKKVNENINCTVRSNLNFNYNWKFEQGNKYTSLSAKHTLFIQKPGNYQCEVEYNIRNVSCVYLVSAVAAVVEDNNPNAIWHRSTLLGLTLPIVLPLLGLIILLVGLNLRQRHNRFKQRLYTPFNMYDLKRKEEKSMIGVQEDGTNDVSKIRDRFGGHLHVESSTSLKSCIFIIGTYDVSGHRPTHDVIKINLNQSPDISRIQPIPAKMMIESAAAVYDDSIFVTGIGTHSNEIWRFDSKPSIWKKCTPLVRRRRRHSVAFVGKILYICGGWVVSNEKTLDDVETYCMNCNKSLSMGKLAMAVESAGNCVPFKSSLYIFGGNGDNGKPLGKVQVYDTKSNTCRVLEKTVPIGDSFLRAALWKNIVILVGFYGSCMYNFETEDWKVRDEFKTGAVYFGLAISDGNVFVIGGGRTDYDDHGNIKWICRDDVRYIPIENFLNNEWINWKTCARPTGILPNPTLVYAFGNMVLEPLDV